MLLNITELSVTFTEYMTYSNLVLKGIMCNAFDTYYYCFYDFTDNYES